jgi:hypothetical protein
MILQIQRGFKLLVKSISCLVILMGLNGCIAWPVNKKDVIGIYQSVLQDGTPGLPDGGSEILELKADGTCKQEIALKDGRTFSAQGTWEWDSDKRYIGNQVTITGIYWVIHDDRINPDLEKSLGNVVQSLPAERNLVGRIILGSLEGSHYEKK